MLRQVAEEAAHERSREAGKAKTRAEIALRDARSEVDRTKLPAGRAQHADIPVSPIDREDALRRAAAANEESTRHQSVVNEREEGRDNAQRSAERTRIRAGMLRDQSEKLRQVDVGDIAIGEVSSDDEEVRRRIGELARDVDVADSAYDIAMTSRSQRADQLAKWAGADRFVVADDDEHGRAIRVLRDLFRSEQPFERVAPRASELAAELQNRDRLIAQHLEAVEVTKGHVVTRLADLVDEALGDLSRASSLSELPEDIGPWAGHRFLIVEPRQRPTKDQTRVRVSDVVDLMVQAGKVEIDPVELLWRATEASVTEGFRATVLKPGPDQPTDRTSVEDMSKWSGGENLTASLVIFCIMAKLRAEKRTGTRSKVYGGLVPLDNPVGTANYLPFLELQRKVAATSGVQLVYFTGLGDLGAVTAFPRLAAMHKRPSTSRPGRAYLRNDEDASFTQGAQVLDVVGSGRVER